MSSIILAVASFMKRPATWLAKQLDIKGRAERARRTAQSFRDQTYNVLDETHHLATLLRAGTPLDDPEPDSIFQYISKDLDYLRREKLNNVFTYCRRSTHNSANKVAEAAENLGSFLAELSKNTQNCGHIIYASSHPVDSNCVDQLDALADSLNTANNAFVLAARSDLR